MPTSQGPLTLPQHTPGIALNGRQSKLVITDYTFGTRGALLYTTASVFFAGTIGSRDVLFLYGPAGQSHEFAFVQRGSGTGTRIASESPRIQLIPPPSTLARSSAAGHYTTVVILPDPDAAGLLTIWDSDEQLVLFADPVTAATFWAPVVRQPTPSTVEGFESYWRFGTNTTVLVGGPHLVRNATLSRDRATLALRGDLNASVPLTVIGPPSVRAVLWNGRPAEVRSDGKGVLSGRLVRSVDVGKVKVPKLEGWKFRDSLPEVQRGFDDSDWVEANHTTTNIFLKPIFGDGRVLYGEWLVNLVLDHGVLTEGTWQVATTDCELTCF